MAQSLNFAHIRISEPGGPRAFESQVTIGGSGADIVVPGCNAGPNLCFKREDAIWRVVPLGDFSACLNGTVLQESRDVLAGDVLTAGAAHLAIREMTRTLLRVDVLHLAGNETIPPAQLISEPPVEVDDLEIREAQLPHEPAARTPIASRLTPSLRYWIVGASLLVALVSLARVETISVDIEPADARVSVPGTFPSLLAGGRLFVFPGIHTLRAEREGYRTAQLSLAVESGSQPVIRLRLLKLPGVLTVNTHGVRATALIDGAEMGSAPGEIQAAAGAHTLTVRAPRYLDFIAPIAVTGAGLKQSVNAVLRPSWGTLVVNAEPDNARIEIDGASSGIAPASLEVPAGLHQVALIAPGYKTWQSNLVIRSGERLEIGPVKLGEPDAMLNVRSRPSGAEISIAGRFKGRAPLNVPLPPGIDYDVVLSLPGHGSVAKSVFAKAGTTLTIDAALAESFGFVQISGEPKGADIIVDGVHHGTAPQKLSLSTLDHKVEVRKDGYTPYLASIAASPELERQLTYQLSLQEKSIALQESAATITTSTGYALRLVPVRRAYYIGINEVTNADFRRFRAAHAAGIRSPDLADRPAVGVSPEDAAEFCNWLSARDGLPPAYERKDGTHRLIHPATTGYRLPTGAEWDAPSSGFRIARYAE